MASKQPFINDSGNRQNITFPASSIELSDGTTAQAAVESLQQSAQESSAFKTSIESKYRKANTAYAKDSMSYAAELPAGFYLECSTAGTTSTGALALPATITDGTTFSDGTVSWTIRKAGGSEVTITRDNVIDALGYTPSNSGLTKAEVEQMIQGGELSDVSVVQLPYKQIVTGTNTPPASNYEGVFTWANKTDSSAKMKFESDNSPGSYNAAVTVPNELTSGNFDANSIAFSGLTIGSSVPGVGVSLAVGQQGVFLKFKGTDGTYQYKSKNKTSASPWISLCNRYGILGQAETVSFLNYYEPGSIGDWRNWTLDDFPYGISSCIIKTDGVYYMSLVMKYGSSNPHANLQYSNYNTSFRGAGVIIAFPLDNPNDAYNQIFMFHFPANGSKYCSGWTGWGFAGKENR